MIVIVISISEETENSVVIGFTAKDPDGCTVLEGDIADEFRKSLIDTRDRVIKQYGWDSKEVLKNVYQRKFDNPDNRDKHAETEKGGESGTDTR